MKSRGIKDFKNIIFPFHLVLLLLQIDLFKQRLYEYFHWILYVSIIKCKESLNACLTVCLSAYGLKTSGSIVLLPRKFLKTWYGIPNQIVHHSMPCHVMSSVQFFISNEKQRRQRISRLELIGQSASLKGFVDAQDRVKRVRVLETLCKNITKFLLTFSLL